MPPTPPGIYVHIPFCLQRCDYCDFNTFAGRDDAIPAYVDALVAHLRRDAVDDVTFGSVFVGGGTPTYLPADQLGRVLAAVGESFDLADDVEWTVEANPETVTEDIAGTLVEHGVNRVSLGAQSFDTGVLQVLGRWHDPENVRRAVDLLGAGGIDRVSVDLIYGAPGETDDSWAQTLHQALQLGTRHISAYALTVEANTPYASRVREQPALQPDDDVQARRMAVADDVLAHAGLRRYEVSNWAAPGEESRHNLVYWRGGDWLGFGAGAHGAWRGRRWWLVRDPERYARMVDEGAEPLGGEEHPDAEARRLERLMMGLRLVEGVPHEDIDPVDARTVMRLAQAGLLTANEWRLKLTEEGMALAGAVIRELA